jgi:sigma-E factor negative regulatory protein RseC
MKNEAEGIVILIDGNIAKVLTNRRGEDEVSGNDDDMEHHGHSHVLLPCNKIATLDADNRLGAKLGQRVVIEVSNTNMLKASFIMFFLPLLTTGSGFLLGLWLAPVFRLPEWYLETGLAAVFLALALIYIRSYDRFLARTKNLPVITRILSDRQYYEEWT